MCGRAMIALRSPLGQAVAVTEGATEALHDAVALWEVRSAFGSNEVISAAVDALVAGADSPSLRELAGRSAQDSYWTLRPLVEGTLEELNISYPGPGSDDVQVAAARVMCKRLLGGGMTARDFAAWAHTTIGHEGAARLQPLVELDDAYDVREYTGRSLEDLETAAHGEATSLLTGEPSLALTTAVQPSETSASAGSKSRFGSVSRRVRKHLGS